MGNEEEMRRAEDIRNTEDIRRGKGIRSTEDIGSERGVRSAEDVMNMENSRDAEKNKSRRFMNSVDGAENMERNANMGDESNMENTVQKKKLTGSFAAKLIAFFLFTVSIFGAVVGGVVTIYAAEEDYYSESLQELFLDRTYGVLYNDVQNIKNLIAEGLSRDVRMFCAAENIDVALMEGSLLGDNGSAVDNPAIIWTTYIEDYEIGASKDYWIQFSAESLQDPLVLNYQRIYANTDYVIRVYFNMDFPENDQYAEMYRFCRFIYEIRYAVIWVLCISVFLALNSFLFLMCSAGRRNDAEGIQPSVFFSIPLDLYTVFYGIAGFFILFAMQYLSYYIYDSFIEPLLFAAAAAAEALWCTFYLRELAVRMKLGGWWRNSVIYYVLRMLKRILCFCGRTALSMFRGIPLILNTMILFFGIVIMEFILIVLFSIEAEGVLLWMLEKLILFPIVVYIALMCKRLLEGSRCIAEGRQEAHVDTSHMFGDFKECGENLNNIGQGISRAVAERMKSEHLKTELITNVTHDIKTPLTSIINYANLIAEEPVENDKITEYSEVLVRQSGRLKKLLEDLLEASKATTGNLEVDLQPCEVSVILSQAVGEYQQRMDEKLLELIVTQPEEPVNIMADGRHLWRVFDNLLNNICKYAREDSRVYLSVEVSERNVGIIFRNMSKYALNITPEELQERFVRGDRSRHMEGNGLGLSIAKSLTELQNGRMEIVTDGDLFKVSLFFEMI